jgi:AhpD family alkylhydroperoxidase
VGCLVIGVKRNEAPRGETMMTPRLTDPFKLAPAHLQAMMALEKATADSGLETSLIELIKTHVSQINGCAYCIHMHTSDALKAGETPMRLTMLPAWRESSLYSDRERAAIGWADALTKVAKTQAPDADWEALKAQFDETEITQLTFAIGAINTWNRIAIGFRFAHPADRSRDLARAAAHVAA